MLTAENYPDLQHKVEQYIRSYFATSVNEKLSYHNLSHTEGVVASVKKIANHYQLNEQDFFVVTTAAWFHDAGYIIDYHYHEERSVGLAGDFLKTINVSEDIIAAVSQCIMATKMPQLPQGLLAQIVCDADLFHLGTERFEDINKALRKEVTLLKGLTIGKKLWRQNTINLMEQHHYHTDYAHLLLNDKKEDNLQKLKSKAIGKVQTTTVNNAQDATEAPLATVDILPGEENKVKKDRPSRGIETMFRITSNNNQRLSDMADNKAHIMITVNSIILSAIISLLLGKVTGKQDYLALPSYLILGVSVSTIIFSILATRPTLPQGLFTQQEIADKKVNLLFFGNFYKMNLDDYTDGMLKVMADKDFLYGSLIKDVYAQGVVLGRKYRLLRISYNIFMFGLIASVLAFVTASIIHSQKG